MSKEDLIPYIEFDTHQFWLNSSNPANSDSQFIQNGVDDVVRIYNLYKNDRQFSTIHDIFFKVSYLLKGEYFISYMSNVILTNRRLFIWFSDLKLTIPLKNIISYEDSKWSSGITCYYRENGGIQTFKLVNKWLLANAVNNSINKHKNDIVNDNELEILGSFKPAIQSKFGITEESYSSWVEPVKLQEVKIIDENPNKNQNQNQILKPKPNYNGVIILFLFILFIGGCGYFISKWDKSYRESGQGYGGTNSTDNVHYNKITGKKQKKCPWCGGIGRVGYAGDSKEQVERTGMGLGNPCITCNGTGYVDDDQ